jgi:hypothetical protein
MRVQKSAFTYVLGVAGAMMGMATTGAYELPQSANAFANRQHQRDPEIV